MPVLLFYINSIIVLHLTNIPSLELPREFPMTSVTVSGSGAVGQPFNLSCHMTTLERMVVLIPGIEYNITWMKMDSVGQEVIGRDINITTVTTVDDLTTTKTLIFDFLRLGDRGTYICLAEINVTATLDGGDSSDEYDIIFDCELRELNVYRYKQTAIHIFLILNSYILIIVLNLIWL